MAISSRRHFLRLAATGATGLALAACQPKVVEKVVKETVVVTEKEVVKETVVVKEAVEVEKEVTRVVEKEKAADVIQIRYMARIGQTEALLYGQRLMEFNDLYPNVKANLEQYPGGPFASDYVAKLFALQAAGDMGDACWSASHGAHYFFFAERGLTTDHAPLIEADSFDMGQFFQPAVDVMGYKGSYYGLPMKAHISNGLLGYNRDLLEEKGIAEPTGDWTMDDWIILASQLTEDADGDGKTDTWGTNVSTGSGLMDIVLPFGGNLLNEEGTEAQINSAEVKEGLRWLYDVYFQHKVVPSPEAMQGINSYQLMASGKLATLQTGFYSVGNLNALIKPEKGEARFRYWMVPMPYGVNSVRPNHIVVDCVSVTSASEHKQETFDLLKTFTDKEAGIQLAMGDGVPGARLDLYDDPRMNGSHHTENDTEMFALWQQMLKECNAFRYPQNLRNIELYNIYSQELDKLWRGEEDPTDAFFDRINVLVQKLLERPTV